MKNLTLSSLKKEAKRFCNEFSEIEIREIFGVSDGKAIGTFVEHQFKDYLKSRDYTFESGNSANGLDFPTLSTDLKVTSLRQPQSSCPFKDSKQKIFGLGYNLLLFVYEKVDDAATKTGKLKFVNCTFIEAWRTGDYQTTTGLQKIIQNDGNVDDVFAYLIERNIPADEVTLYNLAAEILQEPPQTGYLTISNALQWRLQYSRIVTLEQDIEGISCLIRKN